MGRRRRHTSFDVVAASVQDLAHPRPSVRVPSRSVAPNCAAPTGAVYGLGFLGAVIYYISTATSFWQGVLGFLKALVWPAFLVYELLGSVGA